MNAEITSTSASSFRSARRAVGASAASLLLLLSACSTTADDSATADPSTADGAIALSSDDVAEASFNGDLALFDTSVVHDISVEFNEADYAEMIETFTTTGEKDWISATVTIDGTVYEDVGLRLKGNSSLFSLTVETSGNPEDLPWLIRLNKFVDGEDHQGVEDIVIRSTSTETALNEAVAQTLLAMTGLAAQSPMSTTFTVNGGETELRLAVENPDEEWYENNFADEDGLLYKADSEGDYSYRGEDAEAYVEVFEQKVGDDNYEPLIEFLDFINNSDDATFNTEIGAHLDIEAFATYLAFQDLIGNADDINGRGNNSYLQYDTTTGRFTVVSWDLNLAFDTANVTGPGAGGAGPLGAGPGGEGRVGGERNARPERDAGAVGGPAAGGPAAGGGAGGPGDQPNVLVDRFMANAEFAAMYASETAVLTELLFTSGTVDSVIADWSDVLINQAADLVPEATVTAEANALLTYIEGVR